MRIPLFRPVLSEDAVEAVGEVLRSGWLGLGAKTLAFERAFAEYTQSPFCVGVNSCTSALHLCLHLLNLAPGTEVITTPLTFVATNHVILYENCQPVFADVERYTGNLDVDSVSERITEQTGAIVLVHYGGYPCDLDGFYALARDRGIDVVEDCAHACGATYKGQRIGSHGDFHAFSFHPVKNLPMADGGALTVRSEEHDVRARRLRWFGISADTFERTGSHGYRWAYDVTEVGFKYHMNDVQAALGLAQLVRLDEDNARRAEIAAQYCQQLSGVPGVRLLEYAPDRTSSYHLFSILAEKRDALVDKLQASGVDVGVHYLRNDKYPMFKETDLPNVEYFWRHEISLPMHLALTDDQVGAITDLIRKGW